jgi:hypothetical protein
MTTTSNGHVCGLAEEFEQQRCAKPGLANTKQEQQSICVAVTQPLNAQQLCMP